MFVRIFPYPIVSDSGRGWDYGAEGHQGEAEWAMMYVQGSQRPALAEAPVLRFLQGLRH